MAETQYFAHDIPLSTHSVPAGKPVKLTIAYRTYGNPSNASSRAVLIPSCYGGKLDTTMPFLYGPESTHQAGPPVFDLQTHFVIVTGLLGGSESSSPSTMTEAGYKGANFPETSYEDNIELQRALCQHLGVQKLFAYVGFSMGGQQAYHMATLYPSFVEHVVAIATSARTSWHNWAFLEGPKAALVNSTDFNGGRYEQPARIGTAAFGRVYSAWALSPEWFRQECWRQTGANSPEEYIRNNWESAGIGAWDANDLLCLLQTWQKGNIATLYPEDGGDLTKALGRIQAKILVMPSRTDSYFPPEDNVEEVKHLKHGKLAVIESIYGHLAGGGGGSKEDSRFIQDQIRSWVSTA